MERYGGVARESSSSSQYPSSVTVGSHRQGPPPPPRPADSGYGPPPVPVAGEPVIVHDKPPPRDKTEFGVFLERSVQNEGNDVFREVAFRIIDDSNLQVAEPTDDGKMALHNPRTGRSVEMGVDEFKKAVVFLCDPSAPLVTTLPYDGKTVELIQLVNPRPSGKVVTYFFPLPAKGEMPIKDMGDKKKHFDALTALQTKNDYGQKFEAIFDNTKWRTASIPGDRRRRGGAVGRRMQEIYNVGLETPTTDKGLLRTQIVDVFENDRRACCGGDDGERRRGDGSDSAALDDALSAAGDGILPERADSKYELALFTNVSFRVFLTPDPAVGGYAKTATLPRRPPKLSRRRLYTPRRANDKLCVFDCIRRAMKMTNTKVVSMAKRYSNAGGGSMCTLRRKGLNARRNQGLRNWTKTLDESALLLEKVFNIKLYLLAHDEEMDDERGNPRKKLSVIPIYTPRFSHPKQRRPPTTVHLLLTNESSDTAPDAYFHAHLVLNPEKTLNGFRCSLCNKSFMVGWRMKAHKCKLGPTLTYPGGPRARQMTRIQAAWWEEVTGSVVAKLKKAGLSSVATALSAYGTAIPCVSMQGDLRATVAHWNEHIDPKSCGRTVLRSKGFYRSVTTKDGVNILNWNAYDAYKLEWSDYVCERVRDLDSLDDIAAMITALQRDLDGMPPDVGGGYVQLFRGNVSLPNIA
uniref:Uncharacterized protein n=2 Tax=Capitella teleta TaxID=283909 RepID=X2ABG6_CAPTE